MKRNTHKQSGQGIVILIILVLVIGGGLFYLSSNKQAMDKEGRAFGKEAINRIVLNYDIGFLGANLSPEAKLSLPPSEQNALINQLRQLGQPVQGFKIDENMSWQGTWIFKFFEPSGQFIAHLNYPAGPATLEIDINHPVSKWQIINLAFQGPSQAR
jgi:hypothetical protein